jgi:nucleoside-diphosphate-sugar epimerase
VTNTAGTANLPTRVLVTGAGGFIGHHLVKYLVEQGYWVRGVDVVEPAYEATASHSSCLIFDKERVACRQPRTWMRYTLLRLRREALAL